MTLLSKLNKKGEKFYYLFSEGTVKASILILFPFFTHYLAKDDFGKLSLFWISVPFLSLFIDFSQRSYVKKVYITDQEKTGATIKSIYLFCFFAFLTFIALRGMIGVFDIYFLTPQLDYYVLVAAFLFVLIEIFLSYLQIKGNALSYSIIYLIKALSPYLITVGLFIWANQTDLNTFPLAQILVFSLVSIFVLSRIFRTKEEQKLNYQSIRKNLGDSLRFGTPMILGTLSATGLNVADRYIISFYEGDIDVANYTVAYTIASILSAFYLATNKWWQRFILNSMKNNELAKVRSVMWKYILVVVLLALIIFALRREIILLISNDSYLEVITIIPVLLLGMLFYFLYTLLFNVPFYFGKTTHVVMPAFVAFILNLALNFILIPLFGYKIAALTTTIAYLAEFLLMYFLCLRKYKIDLLFGSKFLDKG